MYADVIIRLIPCHVTNRWNVKQARNIDSGIFPNLDSLPTLYGHRMKTFTVW